MKRDSAEFIALITQSQAGLQSFIRTLVPNSSHTADILQNTNIAIWQKAEDFQDGTSFMAWACRIAYFEVLNFRRRMRKEQQIFSDELVEALAIDQQVWSAKSSDRESALRECLDRISGKHRRLLERRYAARGSVKRVAADEGKSVNAISQMLFRLRTALGDCIERRMNLEAEL
jgi:RNA polymerase sigma-70 factor, ECF subfamily